MAKETVVTVTARTHANIKRLAENDFRSMKSMLEVIIDEYIKRRQPYRKEKDS